MVSFTKAFMSKPTMDVAVKTTPNGTTRVPGRGLRRVRRRARVGWGLAVVVCVGIAANLGITVFNLVSIQRLWQAHTAMGGAQGNHTGVNILDTAAQSIEQGRNCNDDCPPWQLTGAANVLQSNSSFHVPVAHLAGLTGLQVPPSLEGSISTINDWQVDPGGSSFWRHGMDVTSRQNIVVPLTGYYYVYNQVQFRQTSLGGTDGQTLHFTHIVLRRRGSSSVASRLLIGRATKKVSSHDGAWYRTSYVGGVFHLKAGDDLYVDVTNFDKVNPQESGTYFGAYLLSR